MRLVDADRLSEAIYDNVSAPYEEAVCAKEDCLTEIYEAPTVDAVPVVRCRECKYHHDCGTHFCDALGMDCPDDSEFFCSYGERKEGADNG